MPKKAFHTDVPTTWNFSPPAALLDHSEVVLLAYELWLGRGCPIGSPEVDWFRAEELLRSRTESSVKAERAMAASGD